MAATSSKQFKNIYLLFGFLYGKYKEFVQAAIDLGQVLAGRKIHPVYRGGDLGVSNLVSEAAYPGRSQVLGIIPKTLKPLGRLSGLPTEDNLVVPYMQERITEMLNQANAFLQL
ncbi:hypothetical protein WN944_001290 [Citrus x changshan-huyou]|uniref:Uncharacterized protein n=1 Tax=Citrus x changshan-huyou TaxID=2935761 RepID=A0AAP0QMK5_9ROSI